MNQPPIKFNKEQLIQWYVVEKRSYRWIMSKLNFNSARTLKRAMVNFGIDIRTGSAAVKTQWINAEERKRNQAKFSKEFFKPYRCLPKSDETKRKISIANKGQKNPSGPDNPMWLGGKKNWKNKRRLSDSKRKAILYIMGNKCFECGENKVEKLQIHHIIPWRISKSHDLNNIKVLCFKCHLKLPLENR